MPFASARIGFVQPHSTIDAAICATWASVRTGVAAPRLTVGNIRFDRLASWNFTSLWLIGVWHRSPASEKIKRMTGNPEAAPSAYSLHEYEIAPDLGGEGAFGDLSHRAWQRGIRLAADMVPNHTGITSRWMRDPGFGAGADCLAVISDLFDAPDIPERARSYGKLWPHEITQ